MTGRISDRRFWVLAGAIVVIAIALRACAFSLFDTIAHDEILQYQERAWRMVFGYGIVPWETRYGMRNALIPDLLAGAMAAARLFSDNPWASVISARVLFAAVCLGALPAAFALGSARSRVHGLVAMFVAAVWCESVLFGVQVLSESVALPFAVGGAAALLRAKDSKRAGYLAGLLLAMAVLLRLQFAVFAGVLALLSIGRDWGLWRRLAIGSLPVLALGAATDLAAGAMPFAWIVNNFVQNVHQGRAADFGTFGPFYYLSAVFLRLTPVSLPILIGAALAGRRYWPLLAAAAANILVHSLIGHKEYRFVFLSTFVFVTLAAIASVEALAWLRRRREASPQSRPLALACLCLLWAGASWATYVKTGTFSSIRDGGRIAQATIRASEAPGACAIGVAFALRKPVAYTFLQRPVPLYLLPDAVDEGRAPFDPRLTDAVDALVLTDKAAPPASYRRIGCEQDVLYRVCLYRRAGGCRNVEAARDHTYEAVVLRQDL